MFSRKRKHVQSATNPVSQIKTRLQDFRGHDFCTAFYNTAIAIPSDAVLEFPARLERRRFDVNPFAAQLVDIIGIAPAILEFLRDNQKQNAAIRELYGDLQQKFRYLLSIAGAFETIGKDIEEYEKRDFGEQIINICHLVEAFFNFESNYTTHKSLETWNRIKGRLAECCDTDKFLWISRFYMNFAVLTSIADRNNARAKELMREYHEILKAKVDKKAAERIVAIAMEGLQCITNVAEALGRFADTLE